MRLDPWALDSTLNSLGNCKASVFPAPKKNRRIMCMMSLRIAVMKKQREPVFALMNEILCALLVSNGMLWHWFGNISRKLRV